MAKLPNNTIWSGRKRTFFGAPWSFTKYILTDDKFVMIRGVFKQREGEVRLYRIMDLDLRRNLIQRIFSIGTIKMFTADQSSPDIKIKNIRDSRNVKDLISSQVEKQRIARGVTVREEITTNINQADNRAYDKENTKFDHNAAVQGRLGFLGALIGVITLLISLFLVKRPEAGSSNYAIKNIAHYVLLVFAAILILEGVIEIITAAVKKNRHGEKKNESAAAKKAKGIFGVLRGVLVLLIAFFVLKDPVSGEKLYTIKKYAHYFLIVCGGICILLGFASIIQSIRIKHAVSNNTNNDDNSSKENKR